MSLKSFGLALCLGMAVVLSGCVAAEHKGATGAGIGAMGGAALGAGIGAATGSPGLGAAIGAGAGALTGKVVGDVMQEKKEKREVEELKAKVKELEAAERSGSQEGKRFVEGHWEYVKKKKWVDTSRKERVWVPERIEGDRRIEGHYEVRVVPDGYWQEYEEKIWVPDHYE